MLRAVPACDGRAVRAGVYASAPVRGVVPRAAGRGAAPPSDEYGTLRRLSQKIILWPLARVARKAGCCKACGQFAMKKIVDTANLRCCSDCIGALAAPKVKTENLIFAVIPLATTRSILLDRIPSGIRVAPDTTPRRVLIFLDHSWVRPGTTQQEYSYCSEARLSERQTPRALRGPRRSAQRRLVRTQTIFIGHTPCVDQDEAFFEV